MRVTRVEKFRKRRRKNIIKFIIFALLLPVTSILLGYLITSLIILPVMSK